MRWRPKIYDLGFRRRIGVPGETVCGGGAGSKEGRFGAPAVVKTRQRTGISWWRKISIRVSTGDGHRPLRRAVRRRWRSWDLLDSAILTVRRRALFRARWFEAQGPVPDGAALNRFVARFASSAKTPQWKRRALAVKTVVCLRK
ncbi:hypothetical protein KCP70_09090 [Salmonella enterica subsp. enterica]|nr:hypothetical protein KCP70_09090 [Salmonella enterica subsp. enterica]